MPRYHYRSITRAPLYLLTLYNSYTLQAQFPFQLILSPLPLRLQLTIPRIPRLLSCTLLQRAKYKKNKKEKKRTERLLKSQRYSFHFHILPKLSLSLLQNFIFLSLLANFRNHGASAALSAKFTRVSCSSSLLCTRRYIAVKSRKRERERAAVAHFDCRPVQLRRRSSYRYICGLWRFVSAHGPEEIE